MLSAWQAPASGLLAMLLAGQVRSGQIYYSAEVQGHEGQAKKKTFES